MTQENLNLEQMVDLGVLQGYKHVSDFAKEEKKEKYENHVALEDLGEIISEDKSQRGMFVAGNSSPARINKEVYKYVSDENRVKNVKEAVERQKEFLVNSYINSLNEGVIKGFVEDQTKRVEKEISGNKDLGEEDKKKIVSSNVEQSLYTLIGEVLTKLYLNKGGDKDLEEAYIKAKEISGLDSNKLKEHAKNSIGHKLAYGGEGLYINTSEEYISRWASQYARNIGKKMLKKTDQGYVIDKETLVKSFGNEQSYLSMVDSALKAQNEQTKE